MKVPGKPANENARLNELRALEILDTDAEERFDRYTRLIKRVLDVPIALVSLVDENRQWFKSRTGLDARETPRDISFCGHAICHDDLFVVEDASSDPRFSDNPLVQGGPQIRFYAGCPLKSPEGHNLGTLCVIDDQPRTLSPEDKEMLADLGDMVAGELAALRLATLDELTGISNRRGLNLLGAHILSRREREREQVTAVVFDLDGFKQINDRFGHKAGDRGLVRFTKLMLKVFRQCDIVARIGGDEFCVLMTDTSEASAACAVARLYEALEAENEEPSSEFKIRFSAGLAAYKPARHSDLSAVIATADARMFEQKRLRARVRVRSRAG